MDINALFTRELLRAVLRDIRQRFPAVKARSASITCSKIGQHKHYFFQFQQDGFAPFDYELVAHDANEARAKGWQAWLRKMVPDNE